MENEVKNYGLDLEKERADREDTDWELGFSSIPSLFTIPQEERVLYLPAGEIQRSEKEDMLDCASRAPVNKLETEFNYGYQKKLLSPENRKWLEENDYVQEGQVCFSDAFVAILSGTTKRGNSLKAPCHAIHEHGLIPKKLLPLEKWMTWEDYHNPERITEEMKALGKEFLRRFTINYERVYEKDFESLGEVEMIDVGGYAWPFPDTDGVYQRVDRTPNHAFLFFKNPKYYIFDNYIDTHDRDFIKRLAPDYDLIDYGYRVFISAEHVYTEGDGTGKINWLTDLYRALKDFFRFIFFGDK